MALGTWLKLMLLMENDLRTEMSQDVIPHRCCCSPSASPTQSNLLRDAAAARVTGSKRPGQEAQEVGSDQVAAVPEQGPSGHQR